VTDRVARAVGKGVAVGDVDDSVEGVRVTAGGWFAVAVAVAVLPLIFPTDLVTVLVGVVVTEGEVDADRVPTAVTELEGEAVAAGVAAGEGVLAEDPKEHAPAASLYTDWTAYCLPSPRVCQPMFHAQMALASWYVVLSAHAYGTLDRPRAGSVTESKNRELETAVK